MNDLYDTLEEQMRVVVRINEMNERTRKRLLRMIRIQSVLIVVLLLAIALNVGVTIYRLVNG